MPRLVYIVTSSISAKNLLRGQLNYMREAGYDVHVIAGDSEHLKAVEAQEGVPTHYVPMAREIAPKADLRSLKALQRKLAELKPDIVNASTPKAGLLGMIAAKKLKVKGRVYVLRGLRLETLTGLKRKIMLQTERRAAACAQRVVCVSHSLAKEGVSLGLFDASKALTINAGSSNGIKVDRFLATEELLSAAKELRKKLAMPEDAVVIGFVGRFVKDKGMRELMEAFTAARAQNPKLALLLVGDYESGDPVDELTKSRIETSEGVYKAGYLNDTAPTYHLMNALCLPTYREGFPNVPIEAGAAGVPVIASNATGAVDSVVDGVTGWLVPKGDAKALEKAFLELASDLERAKAMGEAGRQRALTEFEPTCIWDGLRKLYQELLQS